MSRDRLIPTLLAHHLSHFEEKTYDEDAFFEANQHKVSRIYYGLHTIKKIQKGMVNLPFTLVTYFRKIK